MLPPKKQPEIAISELQQIVCCKQCKQMLWEYRALKMIDGEIVSHEFVPIGHKFKFTGKNTLCPKCGDMFYTVSPQGEPQMLFRDPKSGKMSH